MESVIFAHVDVFTVEEAIEKLGFGPFQILITVFSGMLWVSYWFLVLLSYQFHINFSGAFFVNEI